MAGTAVIFISTADTSGGPAESDLADLFDLSPMQRQVALRLFAGRLRERSCRRSSDYAEHVQDSFSTAALETGRLAPDGVDAIVVEAEGADLNDKFVTLLGDAETSYFAVIFDQYLED